MMKEMKVIEGNRAALERELLIKIVLNDSNREELERKLTPSPRNRLKLIPSTEGEQDPNEPIIPAP